MTNAGKTLLKAAAPLALALLLSVPAQAADIDNYCVTPSFLAPEKKSNLLLMIDNSASMYDLAYVDEGRKSSTGATTRNAFYCYDQSYKSKFCSNETTKVCSADSDCGSGECTQYSGYFQPNQYYKYNADVSVDAFEKINDFPDSCTKYISNTLCIDIDATKKVTLFAAKGSYLNWLTASKFDIQKGVLTGGKYENGKLVGESRGCVGRGFIKEANVSPNFQNYDALTLLQQEANNKNESLGISFSIKGPQDAVNPTSASPGGPSVIEIYGVADYDHLACQNAINLITAPTKTDPATIRAAVSDCLESKVGTDISVETKQKLTFNQTVQECWQYGRPSTITPPPVPTVSSDALNTVKNQCTDIYKVVGGPTMVTAGNPASICSSSYAGSCYSGETPTWSKSWGGCNGQKCGDECIYERHNAYCANFFFPQPVTDPTDAPANEAQYDNLPAILSDIGIQGQLDRPLANVSNKRQFNVRIVEPTPPTGLVQEFGNRIRIGAMAFNFLGSSSESAISGVGVTKVCSNAATRICLVDADCASPGECKNLSDVSGASNKDGGKVIARIGAGKCSSSTAVDCAKDAHCPTNERCVSTGVGNHAAGLVYELNKLNATTWTPVTEAFSSAIGYFAKDPSDTTGKTSRSTGLRVNTDDYDVNYNPVEYVCQKNNILLISDGMSTADVNSNVNALASRYHDADGLVTTDAATRCGDRAGSRNLDDLAFLANKYNINTFLTDSTSTMPAKLEPGQFIKTYTVFTGASNGLTGECEPSTLLNQTAVNGGTGGVKTSENPTKLKANLKEIFTEISQSTASGTAASILSNSEGSGANILQAVFYPKKNYGATSVTWTGELQNLWYYIDPFLGKSTVREDTVGVNSLNLKQDYVLNFFFDDQNPQSSTHNETRVRRTRDADGDGAGDPNGLVDTISPDAVKALWRAGKRLHSDDYTVRNIFTPCITGTSCVGSTGLMKFDTTTSSANVDALRPLLQATEDEDDKIIKWVQGEDQTGYRSRTVSLTEGATPKVWKLGDIISSTPRLQSTVKTNSYDLPAPAGYGDTSYAAFVQQPSYKERGMVYVGANDGMLHAFKLGKLNVAASGDLKATITGSDLGKEVWAFIPKNSLPYLRYLTCKAGSNDAFCANQDYNHLYFVDGATTVVDASIGGCATSYDLCAKDTTAGSNWRTVLIGGMGLGGASMPSSSSCADGVDGFCVKSPIAGTTHSHTGLSSYFALDVTDQHFTSGDPDPPKFMWEFAVEGLGFTTTGAATVRIGPKGKNGKWFAVFGSGPTGSIDKVKHQFLGKSNQQLKIFVVDMNASGTITVADKGTKYWEIATLADGSTIPNAFVGSMSNATIDADRWKSGSSSNYQDDALYFGYVQATPYTSTDAPTNETVWNDGGVLRLMTYEDPDPANWKLSKVIDGIGPVTTAISRLQDRRNHKLWLFFGDGRYFLSGEDLASQRRIYGLSEPCYTSADGLDKTCTTKKTLSDMTNRTTVPAAGASTAITNDGWYINLLGENTDTSMGAERVITDPVALTNGAVFFTTFTPTTDACKFGGNSYLWATRYDTGLRAPSAALEGKALVQVSTGSFEEIDLSTRFTANNGRKTEIALTGKPPGDPPPIVSKSNLKPVKRIIQIQER